MRFLWFFGSMITPKMVLSYVSCHLEQLIIDILDTNVPNTGKIDATLDPPT